MSLEERIWEILAVNVSNVRLQNPYYGENYQNRTLLYTLRGIG